jgi:hypothetical protein
MNSRLMSRIIKELSQIERKEKTIAEAEIQLAISKDIEADRKRKRERETAWILRGGEMPQ